MIINKKTKYRLFFYGNKEKVPMHQNESNQMKTVARPSRGDSAIFHYFA
jgi:hypothetical protein